MFDRDLLRADALEVAPRLLGGILSLRSPEGVVALRITEVEAYLGADDPGSHAFRGQTPRNRVMFGEPGHLYTYFTYGMHTCANIVCSPAGEASAVLLRAGEIIEGADVATLRRTTSRSPSDLASGPARLCVALGITLAHGGADLASPPFDLTLPEHPIAAASGPRTGVSGPGGSLDFPWRFWIPGDPTVSPYRLSTPKKRP